MSDIGRICRDVLRRWQQHGAPSLRRCEPWRTTIGPAGQRPHQGVQGEVVLGTKGAAAFPPASANTRLSSKLHSLQTVLRSQQTEKVNILFFNTIDSSKITRLFYRTRTSSKNPHLMCGAPGAYLSEMYACWSFFSVFVCLFQQQHLWFCSVNMENNKVW